MAATKVKAEDGPIVVRLQMDGFSKGKVTKSFLTHRDDPLCRIFLDFCNGLGLVYSSIRFTYEGARVCDSQTPRDFEMADGDIIIHAFSDKFLATKVKAEDGPIVVRIKYCYGPFGASYQARSFLTHTRDDPLRRIFLDFSDVVDLPYSSFRFIYAGASVRESQTPRDLKMADGSVIHAIVRLRGC